MANCSPPQTATVVHIRWSLKRDMPEILAIERASFERPWTEDAFLRALRERHTIGMVAELGDLVVGFMVYEVHRGRYHLLRLAVDPGFRRQGIGRQLAAKMAAKLEVPDARRDRVVIHCREHNLAGQLFLRAVGFRADRVLREHFTDTGEDAYVFARLHGQEVAR